MEVYKVVRLYRGKLISAVVKDVDPASVVTYKVGVVALPPEGNGPLAAFRDLDAAVAFVKHENSFGYYADVVLQVYSAHVILVPPSTARGLWCVKSPWRTRHITSLPFGSLLCSAIQLNKLVYPPETT